VTYDLKLGEGSPPTVNDPNLFTELISRLKQEWPGIVDTTPVRFMVSEDFAFYTKSIPALYFGLGVERDRLGSAGVHSPEFTIHPAALAEGVRLLALTAELALANN
jgi:metal-dependent amidase/aminoacylase/carboxypeptidase family protein